MKQFLRLDWDVIAGVLAAVIALVLHFLHVAESSVILAIVLALLALLSAVRTKALPNTNWPTSIESNSRL